MNAGPRNRWKPPHPDPLLHKCVEEREKKRAVGFLDVFGGMPREVWGGSIGFSIPTGLKLSAQGREERATLGENRQKSQPCKGCLCFVNL
jgi:hypothetical protein